MTFLNPLILLGLVAAAVPLIIHLFNFRKPRRVEFSSLEFLKEVERSTMQRVRIKQWLLLALRTLAIACMVIAFARPTVQGFLGEAFAGAAPVAIGVVVDTSPSMNQRDAGGSYLDQARALARQILSDTDARDEVIVMGTGAETATLGPGGQPALTRLEELTMGSSRGSQLDALARAADILGRAAATNRELYLIGDLQASSLLDSTQLRVSDHAPVFVTPVGTGPSENVAVGQVRVRSRIVEADQPVRLSARLTNYGSTPAASYVTSVFLGGERVAQSTADLPAGAVTEIEFSVTPSARGWLAGVVETEDDAFPGDNRAYFTLHVPEERDVLLVAGDGQDVRFVRAALGANPRISLDVQTVPESQLAALDLSVFDLVILAGPASLSTGEVRRVADFTRAGGGVLFFPGSNGSVADYNALFAEVGAGRVRSLPGPATGQAVDIVDRIDTEHPLFDGVLDTAAGQIERPTVFRRMAYEPGAGAEATVMALSSGSPFLQEVRTGGGSMLIAAVAPDPTWSDLPTRGLFIPLMYRALFLLSASGDITGEDLRTGAGAEVLIPGLQQSGTVMLLDPQGNEAIPPARTGVGGTVLDLEGFLTIPGHYTLQDDGVLLRRFAVNPDQAESDLQRMPVDDAVTALANRSDAPVQALDLTLDRAARLVDARRGAELWNVFLALALLFLAAEMVVAKQWKPETAAAA
ncbi:MAG: BatA and WFA domain-containing protein [Rhodothermales bacterium]|nr:BatA and WFA domain-containing protein [Rhodothermales bacterium]MBO6778863.1 BatA and WFA domain-containing protein [Rhodothermales bacterium]